MSLVLKGVMQSPVTPLKEDFSPDLATFEKLLDFHVRTGATAISWPHHKGESLNLTIPERKAFAEVAVKVVNGRVPVSIHVSALAIDDSMELVRHAKKIGADAIIAITPYFWKYTNESLYDYFVKLGTTTDLPLIAYNSPSYLDGVEFDAELTRRLIERLPNFIAMKEASFNSEKYLEIARVALALRPEFSLISGVEFLAPAIPMGGKGSYSSAGAICVTRRLRPTPRGSERPKSSALIHGVFVRFITIGGPSRSNFLSHDGGRPDKPAAAGQRNRRKVRTFTGQSKRIPFGRARMIKWILILLVIAAVASLLGFPMLAGAAATGARILIGIVLVLFLLVIFGLIAIT